MVASCKPRADGWRSRDAEPWSCHLVAPTDRLGPRLWRSVPAVLDTAGVERPETSRLPSIREGDDSYRAIHAPNAVGGGTRRQPRETGAAQAPPRGHSCLYCDAWLPEQAKLEEHVIREHPECLLRDLPATASSCPICDKAFEQHHPLRAHMWDKHCRPKVPEDLRETLVSPGARPVPELEAPSTGKPSFDAAVANYVKEAELALAAGEATDRLAYGREAALRSLLGLPFGDRPAGKARIDETTESVAHLSVRRDPSMYRSQLPPRRA